MFFKKIMPVLGMTLAAFYSMSAVETADEIEQLIQKKLISNEGEKFSNIPGISPWVIPPGTQLNKFDLSLVLGQDDELSFSPLIPFDTESFKQVFDWNDAQVTSFRQAAINWFIERFGIDFSGGFFDPVTGTVTTSFGILIPVLYKGDYRVLQSNNIKIPPYTILTPSSVVHCEYTVIFTQPPVYTGTYANGGAPIAGNITDVLAYHAVKIFLNYAGTKSYKFFGRAYYPTEPVIGAVPTRQVNRYQIYSEDFGPGFGTSNGSIEFPANPDGKYNTNTYNTMTFPGSHLETLADYNGFTEPPFTPF